MLATSLSTHSTVDHDLFPLLNVQCCVSEARESRNGPRFTGQDIVNGTVYELRCRRITSGEEPATSPTQKSALLAAQDRIDALMAASAKIGGHGVPRSVLLPVDVYIQEQPSTGAAFVVSVEPFAGLSLGDIVRSGWTLVDENTFLDVLQAAEEFGKASRTLPPHGNLSTDSLKQVLLVRDGATETNCPSRWVVSDWLLAPDAAAFEAETTGDQLLQDLEWLLHSCFSMLNVTSVQDGAFLSTGEVEDAINAMVDRVRHHLASLCATPQANPGAATTGSSRPPGDGGRRQAVRASALLAETANLTIQEKIAYHQNALRSEQVVVQRHRRKRGQLPPLAQQAAGSPGGGAARPPGLGSSPTGGASSSSLAGPGYNGSSSADAYELHYLSSPIVVKPSQLLTLPHAPPLSDGAVGETAITRDDVLNCVIDLAVRDRERKDDLTRKAEAQQHAEREALRAKLARDAPPAPVPRRVNSPARGAADGAVLHSATAAAPASQRERSAVRRGPSGGAVPMDAVQRGGPLTSARRTPAAAAAPASAAAATASAQPTPTRTPVKAPAGGGVAPALVTPKPGTARSRSVPKSVVDVPVSAFVHEQSPEPRPPTPFSKPILKSVQPPPQKPRFGLTAEPARVRPQSAAAGPHRRAIPTHLTEKRQSPLVHIPTTNARPAAPSPTATTPHTQHGSRRASTKTADSGNAAVPAQRVERRREPQRLVLPGRATPTVNPAAPPPPPLATTPESAANPYPFVKPLPLHQLVRAPPGEETTKSGRAVHRSPRAHTARPRRAGDKAVRASPIPQTAREPRVRPPSPHNRLSPRSGRGAAGARAPDAVPPSSPRQPWNSSPRLVKPSAAGAHRHHLTHTPRGSGSPLTTDRGKSAGSPRPSGSAPAARSTSRGASGNPVRAKPALTTRTSATTGVTKTRPVTAAARKPRRESDAADHLSKGSVYPVNETSVGIGLRLARMRSGTL